MKKIIPLFTLLIILAFSSMVYAHPGRTDENGGHYDRSTGEYHYHHGYPAHQHENGICPYNYDDKTFPDAEARKPNSSSTTVEKSAIHFPSESTSAESLFACIFSSLFLFLLLFILYKSFKKLEKSTKTMSSDIMCIDTDSAELEHINDFQFTFIPYNYEECNDTLSDIICVNPNEPTSIELLALFTISEVYHYHYRTDLYSWHNYICGSRLEAIDSIVFTTFLLYSYCLDYSNNNAHQTFFYEKYISLIKKCLTNNLLLNLCENNAEKIFDERFHLYEVSYSSSKNYNTVLSLFISLICQDNLTQGYESYNPDLLIDKQLLIAVSDVLIPYYGLLITDCDTTVADVLINYLNS